MRRLIPIATVAVAFVVGCSASPSSSGAGLYGPGLYGAWTDPVGPAVAPPPPPAGLAAATLKPETWYKNLPVGPYTVMIYEVWWSERIDHSRLSFSSKNNGRPVFDGNGRLLVRLLIQNDADVPIRPPPLHVVDGRGRLFARSREAILADDSHDLLDVINPGTSELATVMFNAPSGGSYRLVV